MTLFSSSKAKTLAPEDHDQDLKRMSSSSSIGSDAPPAYDDIVGAGIGGSSSSSSPNAFAHTSQLQVEAIGYDTNQALTGTTMETISVYNPNSSELEYTSIRLKRSSNSCALVRGSDPNGTPLISTIYRWGPGRPPRMRILPANTSASVEDAINSDNIDCDLIEVKSRSFISRTQKFETSFGTFEWRYGSRSEKKEDYDAASLLVLERTDPASTTSTGSKSGKRGVRIAQLVRNDEFRTPGTKRCMGGNGGRLMMDLSMWRDEKRPNSKDIEAFVVSSCILMLKREADRFRDNTIAAVV
ncbi:hypothetical protein H072_298 [Dactylellina haptotyla CBS 200.50]|uniref:Uncharacterized protein n=1 Tax=Dactylellina haptotyla (strain CBS 200.50) TaxID=1284197 RepID=S8CDW5_DACHA|nr:hypothetical protein H072_298 [Dactylellina haptotyla CBS 200.50]